MNGTLGNYLMQLGGYQQQGQPPTPTKPMNEWGMEDYMASLNRARTPVAPAAGGTSGNLGKALMGATGMGGAAGAAGAGGAGLLAAL
jgi:hypothetical protein